MDQQIGGPPSATRSEKQRLRKYRVFISHAGKDYAKAKQIQTALQKVGIEAFMFEGGIPTGEEFAQKIRDELNKCDEVCLLWTKNSMESDWVIFETGGAHALGRYISPVLDEGISPARLPEALRGHQFCLVYQSLDYAEQVLQRARSHDQERDFQPRRLIAGQDSRGDWQVIAHCDDSKWERAGFCHAPGKELRRGLSAYGPQVHLAVLGETEKDEHDETAVSSLVRTYADAVFLLDSPRNNPLVRHVLATYRRWVSFGSIRFELKTDRASGFEYEQIVIQDNTTFLSDKYLSASTRECLVGSYRDYFVVLCLPGSVLGMDRSDARLWVLCGIHAKGTWAAVRLFEEGNLQQFAAMIAAASPRCCIPDYFEAVCEVPNDLDVRQKDLHLASLKAVHFSELLSRDKEPITDGMDAHLVPLFRSKQTRAEIPIRIAHVDPVAGCNFACPGCIEDELRERKVYLSFPRCVSIFCSLKRCGCRKIGFYGGEPTLHPDFPCMLRVASEMGFDISLVTNGSRLHTRELHRAIVDSMDSPRPPQLRVSVDADEEDTHARVHGKGSDMTLALIKRAVAELIQECGVSVSISYRLVPSSFDRAAGMGNVFEAWESCRYWRKHGARQFSLRPMTGAGGKEPLLLSEEERRVIAEIRGDSELAGFVSLPDWLGDMAATASVRPQPKGYRTCYSAFYRVVISPGRPKPEEAAGPRLEGLVETQEAWLSLCSYHRLESAFGTPFPEDLAQWMKTQRMADIRRIDPHEQCANVLCCRNSYNESVHKYLRSCRTQGRRQGGNGPSRRRSYIG